MNTKVKNALNFMLAIANDSSHGYDQIFRWGERGDYDCSSLVITAFEQAGILLKTHGATYTGNMKQAALRCGFIDVTGSVALSNGKGIKPGDILLNTVHHVAVAVTENGATIVHASINEKGGARGGKPGDQTGREICTRGYYNYPWSCVLRYSAPDNNITVKEFNGAGVASVGDYLNCRAEPSAAAEIVGAFAPGDVIYINGVTSNGWYRCRIWNGTNAYVCGDFVKDVMMIPANNGITPVTGTGTAAVSTYLNCRVEPSETAEIVGAFAPGDVIYINGKTSNGWYRCRIWNGTNAYVCGKYVSDLKLSE